MKIKAVQKIIFALSLFASSLAFAAIQEHTFGISGDNGETGSGTFTWDDSVVPDGSSLANGSPISPNVLSLSITISGGNVAHGTTSFDLTNCTDAILWSTPDFTGDINFWCDNGDNSLHGIFPFGNELNGGVSQLSFEQGKTLSPVPTMSVYGLLLIVLSLSFVAFRNLRVSARRN